MANCHPDGRAKKGDVIGESLGKEVRGTGGGSLFARVGEEKRIDANSHELSDYYARDSLRTLSTSHRNPLR